MLNVRTIKENDNRITICKERVLFCLEKAENLEATGVRYKKTALGFKKAI